MLARLGNRSLLQFYHFNGSAVRSTMGSDRYCLNSVSMFVDIGLGYVVLVDCRIWSTQSHSNEFSAHGVFAGGSRESVLMVMALDVDVSVEFSTALNARKTLAFTALITESDKNLCLKRGSASVAMLYSGSC